MPWRSDPSRPFPKSRRWHKRHAARLVQQGCSGATTPSNASTVGLNGTMITKMHSAPVSPISAHIALPPAVPRVDISPKSPSPPLSSPTPTPASPKSPVPPPPRQPPKSWSALVSQNTKKSATPQKTLRTNIIANGKMGGLGAALTSFDPFSTNSAIAPVIRPRGLINTGNLCFMNVILQALLYCPPFYNLLDTIRRHVLHKIASQTPLLDALYLPFSRR